MRPGSLAETVPKSTKADDRKPPSNLWAKIESRHTPRFYIGNNRFGRPLNEAFRVFGPGGLKRTLTLFQHALCPPVVDIVRGEHGDPAMPMLGVVSGEERPAEGDGGGDVVEAPREAGMVLQGF